MRGDRNISQSFSTFPVSSLNNNNNNNNNNSNNNNNVNSSKSNSNISKVSNSNNNSNSNSGSSSGSNSNNNSSFYNKQAYHQSLSISSGNFLQNNGINSNNSNNNNNNTNGRHIAKGLQQSSSTSSVQQQQQLHHNKHLSLSSTVSNSQNSINSSNYSGINNQSNYGGGSNNMPLFLSNGPSSFPPPLRKFRHIKSIIGRNLEPLSIVKGQSAKPILYSCYYTLHAPPQQPIYETFIFPHNNNNSQNKSIQDSNEYNNKIINDDTINTTPNKLNGVQYNNNNNNNSNNNNNENDLEFENLKDMLNELTSEEDENTANNNNIDKDKQQTKNDICDDNNENNNENNSENNNENNIENKFQYQNDENCSDNDVNNENDNEQEEEEGEDDDLPPPFYTSEVVPNSNNPLWNPFDCYKQLPIEILDTFCSFNICVWDKNNEESPPIYQSDIDLTQLEFIATEIKQFSNMILPSNSIIFELKDGFYITRETKMQMNSPNLNDIQKIINNEKRKAITGNKTLFLCIVAKKLYNIRTLENSKRLSKEIEDRLDRESEYLEKQRQLENQRNRINLLREEALTQQNQLQGDQDKFNHLKRGLVPRSVALTNAGIQFYKSFRQLIKSTEVLKMDTQLLRNLKVSWEKKKWNLITQIRSIYPIGQGNKMLTINSLPLPNSDYNGFDEEQIATALGYVCHILHLASKYLDIPLRYPMTPMGSRSFIKDEISHHSSSKFPLYSKGVEKRIFDYAVFLLNKNLEQLLNSQGLFGNFLLKETLPNVQILLGKSKINELFNHNNHQQINK
ncbi:hypothetical protein ACTFIW_012282 [Dictyostelium discoideum]